jgi:hypothetical protein
VKELERAKDAQVLRLIKFPDSTPRNSRRAGRIANVFTALESLPSVT